MSALRKVQKASEQPETCAYSYGSRHRRRSRPVTPIQRRGSTTPASAQLLAVIITHAPYARARAVIFFLRRCSNAETLSRHESPDCGAKRGDYACAVTPIQPMPPRGELMN
ncbi:hypothetical protein EVAR_47824_1 [Eumeta japonica]|uniref:Uncharacterized protein n=1 Tax=Eumeta variegata TaxID=151549 RepID=A0A4C1YZE0_EUMVA|nr:hypothetical protein EVAR_47824_1 [Eumeta japonica]